MRPAFPAGSPARRPKARSEQDQRRPERGTAPLSPPPGRRLPWRRFRPTGLCPDAPALRAGSSLVASCPVPTEARASPGGRREPGPSAARTPRCLRPSWGRLADFDRQRRKKSMGRGQETLQGPLAGDAGRALAGCPAKQAARQFRPGRKAQAAGLSGQVERHNLPGPACRAAARDGAGRGEIADSRGANAGTLPAMRRAPHGPGPRVTPAPRAPSLYARRRFACHSSVP